jgi:hypothetical protein
MVVNNLDNFSGNMANGLDSYFNQDGATQQSVSIEGLTCEELSKMYESLADKMAIVSAESEGKQFIVDPLAEYQAEMNLIMSRMVNMGCPIVKSDKVFRSLPPVEPSMQTVTATQQAGVSANPAFFQANAYMRRGMDMGMGAQHTMHAVNKSMHTTANKGKGALSNLGNSIQKVGASAITLVNDALNGLFCGIGLTQLGNCKKDDVAVIRLDEDYSNSGGPIGIVGSKPGKPAGPGVTTTPKSPCLPMLKTGATCDYVKKVYDCWVEVYRGVVPPPPKPGAKAYTPGILPDGYRMEDVVNNVNYLAAWLKENGCGIYPTVSMPMKGTVGGGGVKGGINRVFPAGTTPIPAVAAKTSSSNRQRFSNAAGEGSPCGCGGASSHSSKNTPCGCNEKNIGGRKSRADLFSNADGNNAPCPCKSGKPCPCQSGAPCGCQGKEKSMPNLIKPVNNHF